MRIISITSIFMENTVLVNPAFLINLDDTIVNTYQVYYDLHLAPASEYGLTETWYDNNLSNLINILELRTSNKTAPGYLSTVYTEAHSTAWVTRLCSDMWHWCRQWDQYEYTGPNVHDSEASCNMKTYSNLHRLFSTERKTALETQISPSNFHGYIHSDSAIVNGDWLTRNLNACNRATH